MCTLSARTAQSFAFGATMTENVHGPNNGRLDKADVKARPVRVVEASGTPLSDRSLGQGGRQGMSGQSGRSRRCTLVRPIVWTRRTSMHVRSEWSKPKVYPCPTDRLDKADVKARPARVVEASGTPLSDRSLGQGGRQGMSGQSGRSRRCTLVRPIVWTRRTSRRGRSTLGHLVQSNLHDKAL